MFRQAICKQLGFAHGVIHGNLDGITDADALRTPPEGGSTINWVLGHIVTARDMLLTVAGQPNDALGDAGALYGRGRAPVTDAAVAVPLATLIEKLDASQAQLLAVIEQLTDEQLQANAPAMPADTPLEGLSTGEALAGLVFHESYHAGQLGTLRRVIGKAGAIA